MVVSPPPSRPPKLGGDGSCGCQISPTSPLHNTGKKLTCLWSLWVKQSNFSQKIVILASLRHCVMASWRHFGVISGSVLYPQDPHDLMGMVPMAAKFFIQILSKTREKNWPASEILRVEWSSFSQKTVILVSLPVGGYPSQDPQNLVGMVPMGFKFCSQDPSMKQEKKLNCLWNLRVKQSSFG